MHQYDRELGTITDDDRSNASDLLSDVEELTGSPRLELVETVAQWLRKVRYEAVMSDRKKRSL